jgi:hypothetical protein
MNNYQTAFIVVLYLIILYVFIHTYIYLIQLNNCECFNTNGKYVVNLEFMKFFQILEIFIITIYVGFMLFIRSKINKKGIPTILTSISLAVLLLINFYMAFNVINLFQTIKEDCKCTESIYKYFLYYQGIISFTTILRFVSLLLIIGLVFLFNKLK